MAKNSQQTYSFQDTSPPVKNSRKHSRRNLRASKSDGKKKSLDGSLGQKLESHFQREAGHHHDVSQQRQFAMKGGEKEENSVAEGSLTYSASSSLGGSSNAGESTDSSFADIMKVLELDDSSEIAALMAKEGVTDMSTQEYVQSVQAQAQARKSNKVKGSGASVAHSLAYSEDGESTIADAAYSRYGAMPHGMHSGQPSDSHGPDGGGSGADGVAFPAAAPPDDGSEGNLVAPSKVHEVHRPKNESMRENAKKGKKPDPPSPAKTTRDQPSRSPTPDTSSASSASIPPASPPPRAKRAQRKVKRNVSPDGEKAEAWYSQWWMCGFSDALKEVVGSLSGRSAK